MWNVKVEYRAVESPLVKGKASGEEESKKERKSRPKGDEE